MSVENGKVENGKEMAALLKQLPGEEVLYHVVKLIDMQHAIMGEDATLVGLVPIHGAAAAPEVQRGIRASLRVLRRQLTGEECPL